MTMPVSVRVVIVLIYIAFAISPVVVAPGIAESYGYDRSTGSVIGAIIGMALFGILISVSLNIIRRRARHELGTEMTRLLENHRDELQNDKDDEEPK